MLAADVATVTGVAFDGPNGRPLGATYRVPTGGHDLGAAGLAFSGWLYDLISLQEPELLAVEAPILGKSGGKVFTSELLIGLAFMAAVVAKSHGIRFVRANVQSVRRHFVGQGRPPNAKQAVVDRCRLLHWEPANHNEADAMAAWHWAKATHDRGFHEVGTPMFASAGA